jgi:hypothetical protein
MISIQNWIAQFDEPDRVLAAELIRSLTVVSTTEVQVTLFSLLDGLRNRFQGPVACFAVRPVPHGKYFSDSKRDYRSKRPKPYYSRASRPRKARKAGDGSEAVVAEAVIAKTGDGSEAVIAKTGVGSEAVLAKIITNYTRGRSDSLDHPSPQEMALKKVRHLIMVDDIVGSGQRAWDFIRAVRRHRTIKSWISTGLIHLHYVAYAASDAGEQTINRFRRPPVTLHFSMRPTHGRHLWTEPMYKDMVELCRRYALRTENEWMIDKSIGYGAEFATMVFEYSCPNNTPALLWHSCPNWDPLFPERSVDPLLPLDERNGRKTLQLPSNWNAPAFPRAAGRLDLKYATSSNAIKLLIGVSKGLRRIERLAEFIGINLLACKQLAMRSIQDGFLTDAMYLTASGRSEVRYVRTTPIHPDWTPALERDRLYFPQSLRGGRAHA